VVLVLSSNMNLSFTTLSPGQRISGYANVRKSVSLACVASGGRVYRLLHRSSTRRKFGCPVAECAFCFLVTKVPCPWPADKKQELWQVEEYVPHTCSEIELENFKSESKRKRVLPDSTTDIAHALLSLGNRDVLTETKGLRYLFCISKVLD